MGDLWKFFDRLNKTPSIRMGFYYWNGARFEQSNATVRWTVASRRLDGGNTSIFAYGENANKSG